MYEQSSVYVVLLALSAGVSAFTAWIAWSRRKIPGAYSVVFFLVGLCFWSLTYALFWAWALFMRPFWLNVTYFGVVTAPVAFFVFTLYQTGRRRWISRRRNLALLFVMPVVCLILLWTDPLHGIFFAGKQTAGSSVILDGGPGFWANLVYLYGLMLIGTVLLAQAWRQSHPVFRAQAGLVLFAALLPWVSNIISLSGLNPLHGLDLTPMSFTLTGLILTYSLYRTGLLDLAPVATARDGDDADEAAARAEATGFPYLLLVDGAGRPLGWLDAARRPPRGRIAGARATPPGPLVEPETTVKDALSMLLANEVQAGIVSDRHGRPLGLITVESIGVALRPASGAPAAAPR